MELKTKIRVLVGMFILNYILAISFAYVGDFHPRLNTLKTVLLAKCWVNGVFSLIMLLHVCWHLCHDYEKRH